MESMKNCGDRKWPLQKTGTGINPDSNGIRVLKSDTITTYKHQDKYNQLLHLMASGYPAKTQVGKFNGHRQNPGPAPWGLLKGQLSLLTCSTFVC